ncbi:MAG TPA: hypothetical protein ENJ38_07475 [Rhodospirillales bacterium]|nr:hypothetical protein [Rhodospirillales bacterium]
MSVQREFLEKSRRRLQELGERIEKLADRLDDKTLADLRAEAEVVREKLQKGLRAGVEVGEEALRSLGQALERLGAAIKKAAERGEERHREEASGDH